MSDLGTSTWFSNRSSPSGLSTSGVILGGTQLLEEFLAAAASGAGELDIILTSPFIDMASLDHVADKLSEARSRTTLQLLTAPSTANQPLMDRMAGHNWRSWRVWACRRLHAKIYIALPQLSIPAALIGSHNLTSAGRTTNHEAGVLLMGHGPEIRGAIDGIVAYVAAIRERSTLMHDSVTPDLTANRAA